jgi:molecular chaperone DnaK (HSP70)
MGPTTTALTIQSLFPAVQITSVGRGETTSGKVFVGIDFGTSTTVISIAQLVGEPDKPIQVQPVWTEQLQADGIATESADKLPSVIAWYGEKLLIGRGAADMKHQLRRGVNVWYSFKMELGEDLGSKYFNSELKRNHPIATILKPTDAATVFFRYLKEQLDRHLEKLSSRSLVEYAVSIPASFEANQRRDLLDSLAAAGIKLGSQALIDEPNAAFLSYLVSSTATERGAQLLLTPDYPLHLLVFDFGAGTCDVSILEIGTSLQGTYSKNLAISQFEKLGGDDVDRLIALRILLPQLLAENGVDAKEFRTPQINKGILPRLLKAAEELKIRLCKQVAMEAQTPSTLPAVAGSETIVTLGTPIEVFLPKHHLTLQQPRLSYREFRELMSTFTGPVGRTAARQEGQEEFVSIFSPVESALKKAGLGKDEIDYVLLIGGSAKNPYIQQALATYFNDSELIIPQDLQTHVAAGAAIHSLIYNGFGKNIIQPIVSEPLVIVTKGGQPEVLVKAGTRIPCEPVVLDDLVTQRDGQTQIEIPICVSSIDKVLQVLKIFAPANQSFKAGTPIRLECSISADKLVHVQATVNGQVVRVEPMNPFANRALSTAERMLYQAERNANIAAEQQGGKPAESTLYKLFQAYEFAENHLRAAETLELIQELYPTNGYHNNIGYYYDMAGHRDKGQHWYEQAYVRNPAPVTAFNLAMSFRYKEPARYEELMEEVLRMDHSYPYAPHYYGEYLMKRGDVRGQPLVQKAFDIFNARFEANTLATNDYHRLVDCARILGDKATAQRVASSIPTRQENALYDSENLAQLRDNTGLARF